MKMSKNTSGFTLIEMLVVLLIISVLILLFVPNLSNQKDAVSNQGNNAIVKVVETQMELYVLENEGSAKPTAEELKTAGYISEEQLKKYNEVKPK